MQSYFTFITHGGYYLANDGNYPVGLLNIGL